MASDTIKEKCREESSDLVALKTGGSKFRVLVRPNTEPPKQASVQAVAKLMRDEKMRYIASCFYFGITFILCLMGLFHLVCLQHQTNRSGSEDDTPKSRQEFGSSEHNEKSGPTHTQRR